MTYAGDKFVLIDKLPAKVMSTTMFL